MTREQLVSTEQSPLPPVCEVSLAAARRIFDPLAAELRNPTSALYAVMADRAARMQGESLFGISSALLVDPTRSGTVARYQLQSGEMPNDTEGITPEQAVVLWAANSKADVPKLRVPEGQGPRIMEVADSLQMRGGGPTIFERSEAARVPLTERTLVKIDGAARNANRERIKSALAYVEATGYSRPIVATVDPSRMLKDDEKRVVASFAPNAQNEQELFIDSARANGFVLEQDGYGARYLPDGSTYVTMAREGSEGNPSARLIVLAPRKNEGKNEGENGVYNGYQTLINHGSQLPGFEGDGDTGEGRFVFEGTGMVAVTSTHYGTMSVVNNFKATHQLRTSLGSYHVIGDNQPARNEQAHLIEIGLTLNAMARAMEIPALRHALLGASAAPES